MKRTILSVIALAASVNAAMAVDKNTVEIKFSGTTATVTIASNISSYVTNQSSGSHVKLVQASTFSGVDATTDNSDGEIIYVLTGSSTDGEFYLEGSYKCTVELNGLTLTNPSGPAINIQNGKRIAVSAKKGTTNTITDGSNDTYNGCFHCKGHTKFKGKGTLNVVGQSKHGVYSKEYIEVKNMTLNVTAAVKDGIHCKEYFLQESGTVKVSGAGDDGIQVELSGSTSTGKTTDHDDEDSGNFYQEDGSLVIGNYGSKAIKADGSITLSGSFSGFTTSDTKEYSDIADAIATTAQGPTTAYDLGGRRVGKAANGGLYIVRSSAGTVKMMAK